MPVHMWNKCQSLVVSCLQNCCQINHIHQQIHIDFGKRFLTSFSSSAIFLFFTVAAEAGVAGFLVAVFGLLADPASVGVFTVVPVDILAFLAAGALQ